MVDEKFFRHLGISAARTADGKKGEDILLLHTGPLSTVADYILIVTGTSPPHINALDRELKDAIKSVGMSANHKDGRASDTWRVLDYGGLLIHLMHASAREFYALEKIFAGARKVAWARRANGTAATGKRPLARRPSPKRGKKAVRRKRRG